MSHLVSASKEERITKAELRSYDGRLFVEEDRYNPGSVDIKAQADSPVVTVLDELLAYAMPGEDECPVREVTLQSLIDEIQSRRDKLNIGYGSEKGQPQKLVLSWSLDRDDVKVISDVMNGGSISWETRQAVRAALSPETKVEW